MNYDEIKANAPEGANFYKMTNNYRKARYYRRQGANCWVYSFGKWRKVENLKSITTAKPL